VKESVMVLLGVLVILLIGVVSENTQVERRAEKLAAGVPACVVYEFSCDGEYEENEWQERTESYGEQSSGLRTDAVVENDSVFILAVPFFILSLVAFLHIFGRLWRAS